MKIPAWFALWVSLLSWGIASPLEGQNRVGRLYQCGPDGGPRHSAVSAAADYVVGASEMILSTFFDALPRARPGLARRVQNQADRYERRWVRNTEGRGFAVLCHPPGLCEGRYSGVWRDVRVGNVRMPRIGVCFREFRGGYLCELVATIAHELGHAMDLPQRQRHNEGESSPPDPVYLLGAVAGETCFADAEFRGRRVPPGRSGL